MQFTSFDETSLKPKQNLGNIFVKICFREGNSEGKDEKSADSVVVMVIPSILCADRGVAAL